MAEVAGLGDELKANEAALAEVQARWPSSWSDPEPAARIGAGRPDETGNVEVRKIGTPRVSSISK
jgi:seryl-tRNA synthetase